MFLEIFKLDGGLTTYISAFHGSAKIVKVLHFLYIGFLTATLVLGMFVASTIGSYNTSKDNINLPLNITELDQAVEGNSANYSNLLNVTSDNVTVKSSKFTSEQISLLIFLGVGFFGSLSGIIIIYIKCDRSRNVLIREVSSLFKTYSKFKDDDLQIKKLEKELEDIFEKYT